MDMMQRPNKIDYAIYEMVLNIGTQMALLLNINIVRNDLTYMDLT